MDAYANLGEAGDDFGGHGVDLPRKGPAVGVAEHERGRARRDGGTAAPVEIKRV